MKRNNKLKNNKKGSGLGTMLITLTMVVIILGLYIAFAGDASSKLRHTTDAMFQSCDNTMKKGFVFNHDVFVECSKDEHYTPSTKYFKQDKDGNYINFISLYDWDNLEGLPETDCENSVTDKAKKYCALLPCLEDFRVGLKDAKSLEELKYDVLETSTNEGGLIKLSIFDEDEKKLITGMNLVCLEEKYFEVYGFKVEEK